MSTYREGIIAIFAGLTILNFAVLGLAILYIRNKTERTKQEGVKIMFLVNNLIDIINTKHNEDEETN